MLFTPISLVPKFTFTPIECDGDTEILSPPSTGSPPVAVPVIAGISEARLAEALAALKVDPHIHTQSVASTIWTVVHDRGYYPDITIYDDQNEQIIGDVRHDTNTISTLTFTTAVSGIARAD